MPGLKITVPAVALTYDRKLLRQALSRAGQEIAALARSLIRSAQGAGRTYSKPGGGSYRASAPGQPPAKRTGLLVGNIRVRAMRPAQDRVGVTVRETAFYGKFLETGARGGGGATRVKANILPAGGVGPGGRMRGHNRMKASAVSKTRLLEPRPYLSLALEQRGDSIADRVRESVTQGIQFERRKP
jgi:hypothetical protein